MSDDEKLASAVPSNKLFSKLIQFQKNDNFNIFQNTQITINQAKLESFNSEENYHLFFVAILLLSKNNKNLFESKKVINSQENENISVVDKHKYMMTVLRQLKSEQQKNILLLTEFILDHKEDDSLWSEYKKLIKKVERFLNDRFID